MRRRLLNLTVLSALLCVTMVALWLRSYWRVDYVGRYILDPERLKWSRWHAMSDRGTVSFGHCWVTFDSKKSLQGYAQNYRPVSGWYGGAGIPDSIRPRSFWRNLGFSRRWVRNKNVMSVSTASLFTDVEFPHWLVASLAAVPPAVRLWRSRRARRRVRSRLCPRCGYDLRATPDRCPECGTENRARSSN